MNELNNELDVELVQEESSKLIKEMMSYKVEEDVLCFFYNGRINRRKQILTTATNIKEFIYTQGLWNCLELLTGEVLNKCLMNPAEVTEEYLKTKFGECLDNTINKLDLHICLEIVSEAIKNFMNRNDSHLDYYDYETQENIAKEYMLKDMTLNKILMEVELGLY